MTNTNQTISSGLLTVFGLLVAGLAPAFSVNHWYGLSDIVAILAISLTYHFFFNE